MFCALKYSCKLSHTFKGASQRRAEQHVILSLCYSLYLGVFVTQLDANETEGRKYRIRPDFKEDPTFKRLTDYNHTAVHIPTDIYDGCEYTHTHTQICTESVTMDTTDTYRVLFRHCL